MPCPACQAPLETRDLFCTRCGASTKTDPVLLTSEIVASRDDFGGSSTPAAGARGPSDGEEGESACRGRRGGGSASPANFAGAARVEMSPVEAPPLLVSACPSCQRAPAPVSRFCTACGTRLHATGSFSPLESSPGGDERRTVSVLHADLVGFTRMAERLSPEETQSLIDALFAVLTREVSEAGGRVDAYIGDALLAVFGAPIAHGDDARRAVDAGAAFHTLLAHFQHPLLLRVGGRLQARVGIDTGPVVVGRVGTARRSTVTGATVANAMALERAAPPGQTLVSESTRALLPGDYVLERQDLATGRPGWLVRVAPGLPLGVPGAGREIFDAQQVFSLSREFYFPPELLGPEPVIQEHPGLSGSSTADRDEPGRVHDSNAPRLLKPLPTPLTVEQAQAQLDQLPPGERQLLKTAAIIGQSFWDVLLDRFGIQDSETLLERLETRRLVEAPGHSTVPGATEYRFLSPLVLEVAYQNNLLNVRRFSHRVVAAWLEEHLGRHLELLPLLVHHYQEGGDRLAAAGALTAAAQRLTSLHALEDARGRYQEALLQLQRHSTPDPRARELIHLCRQGLDRLERMLQEAP